MPLWPKLTLPAWCWNSTASKTCKTKHSQKKHRAPSRDHESDEEECLIHSSPDVHTHRSLFYICVMHSQRLIKLSRLWLFSNVCVYANMWRPAGCWDELCMCVWRVAWLAFLSIRLKPIVRRLKKQKSKKHSQRLLYLGGWSSRGQCAGEIQLSWLRNFALFLSFFVSRSFLFNFHLHPLALSPYKGAVCLISNHIWTSQTLSFYPTKPLNKQTIILPSLSREYGELMPPAVYHIMLNQCLWDCQTVIPYKN